ncbi:hypothetical protein VN97_g1581 [Penicillium thymicola]|uniref:Uncharacterized protein n=1 Tax=Penicillium thymicola TaxID=293382 RepID=A0AAI9TR77_PENTH|nr:hypothetical protein VN97_g1581 [Penicillium thymicola]
MMGPNCLGGNGSLVESLNWTGDYFVEWIKKDGNEDIKYVVPKHAAEDAFGKHGDEIHVTSVWTAGCKSWYKRNKVDGRLTALFGGNAILFQRLTSDIRPEDFGVEYNSTNGFTDLGIKEINDLFFYVEVADESLSC